MIAIMFIHISYGQHDYHHDHHPEGPPICYQ